MGRSFSSTFGLCEPLFGFAKLSFQVPNSSLERPEVALGREVQCAGDALHASFELPLHPTAETKRLHRRLLYSGVAHQLPDPRVLHDKKDSVP
jgi:hypothetical protein